MGIHPKWWRMGNFAGGYFLLGGGNLQKILRPFKPFSKLKATFCEYSTLIKTQIRMTCVYKDYYKVKIKMVQEQRLQLKMKSLLGYNFGVGR